jgi:hypothetical protein
MFGHSVRELLVRPALRGQRLAVAASLVIAVAVASVGSSGAHGLIDQQSSAWTLATSCGVPSPDHDSLYQGFTPTRGGLSGVDLSFQVGGGFVAGRDVRVLVRRGSPTGPVLADRSVFVPGPLSGSLDVHIDFERSVPVRPGMLHYIEWIHALPATELSWKGSDGDPYPGGAQFSWCGGAEPVPSASGERDAVFTTYFGGAPVR